MSDVTKSNWIKISLLIDRDMLDFGIYSATGRHVPHVIDGLKPVQRRTVWMCARSDARDKLVKVMSISGLVATIHPHASAADAISAMVQGFPFTNNYPLLSGKGTFGSEVVPDGVASERYVEARLSEFCRDVLVPGLPASPKQPTFGDAGEEPVYIESRLPLVLLNPTKAISVGFSVGIPGHSLREVVDCMISEVRGEDYRWPEPYFRGWKGQHLWVEDSNDEGEKTRRLYMNWGVERADANTWVVVAAPHDKSIDKLKDRLAKLDEGPESPFVRIEDNSRKTFSVKLVFKRGRCPATAAAVAAMLSKPVNFRTSYTVLWTDGTIRETTPEAILREFVAHRRRVKIAEIQNETNRHQAESERLGELVRFIEEGWPGKASARKNKQNLVADLRAAKFAMAEWLADLSIYRTTKEEVEKLKMKISSLDQEIARLRATLKSKRGVDDVLVEEWRFLAEKYESKQDVERHPASGVVIKKEDLEAMSGHKPRPSGGKSPNGRLESSVDKRGGEGAKITPGAESRGKGKISFEVDGAPSVPSKRERIVFS